MIGSRCCWIVRGLLVVLVPAKIAPADDEPAWLTNPAALKPGCRMPDLKLPPVDIDALVTYLETLR